jgi:two-component system response regulator AlgR
MTINILVVDDEELARERIKRLLHDNEHYKVCAEAENGAEALMMVERHKPELILLDISMPVMDGLEVARHLSNGFDEPPAVIFTTAYGEYALEAFSTKATGYLMKPIRQQQLLQSLEQARSLNRAQRTDVLEKHSDNKPLRKHICARMRGNMELIPVEDIYYFQADQKYVTVKHTKGEVIIEESLKSLEKDLEDRFIRIHRNALVAKNRINGLAKSDIGRVQVRIDQLDERLEVSRRHVAEIRRFVRSK